MTIESGLMEITPEQYEMLRQFGVPADQLQGMSAEEAEALIDELRDERDPSRGAVVPPSEV